MHEIIKFHAWFICVSQICWTCLFLIMILAFQVCRPHSERDVRHFQIHWQPSPDWWKEIWSASLCSGHIVPSSQVLHVGDTFFLPCSWCLWQSFVKSHTLDPHPAPYQDPTKTKWLGCRCGVGEDADVCLNQHFFSLSPPLSLSLSLSFPPSLCLSPPSLSLSLSSFNFFCFFHDFFTGIGWGFAGSAQSSTMLTSMSLTTCLCISPTSPSRKRGSVWLGVTVWPQVIVSILASCCNQVHSHILTVNHTCMHTHMQKKPHAHTHTLCVSLSLSLYLSLSFSLLYTHTHACTNARMHTHTHACMHTHAHTHVYTHARACTHTHACTYSHTYTHTHSKPKFIHTQYCSLKTESVWDL